MSVHGITLLVIFVVSLSGRASHNVARVSNCSKRGLLMKSTQVLCRVRNIICEAAHLRETENLEVYAMDGAFHVECRLFAVHAL